MPLNDGWKELGACRSYDADTWWPNGVTGTEAEKIEAAKRICAQCPVRQECLRYAVEHKEFYGVWGGTTEEERREVRKKTQPARYRGRFVKKGVDTRVPAEVS